MTPPRKQTASIVLILILLITAGGIATTSLSSPASAQVSFDQLSVDGDSASVNEPPSSIDISVSGEWEVSAADAPEQTQVIMQVHVGGEGQQVDDIAQTAAFGKKNGSYSLDANLFDHADVSQGELTPDTSGETQTTELLVRIVVRAIIDGSIKAEAYEQDTALLEISKDGMNVRLGGNGSITVSP